MATRRKEPSEATAQTIRMYRERIQEQEDALKFTRNAARQNLVLAIVREGISISIASELSGTDRRMITLWLQIHNAEQKALKTRATGE